VLKAFHYITYPHVGFRLINGIIANWESGPRAILLVRIGPDCVGLSECGGNHPHNDSSKFVQSKCIYLIAFVQQMKNAVENLVLIFANPIRISFMSGTRNKNNGICICLILW
jgi:hypothetical protein